ncbi:hypothetical protein P4O66_010610, partial [Electrophorus voltai]
LHVLSQSLFAFIEHRRMRAQRKTCSYTKTIGFTISAYQEHPVYLRECLQSVNMLKYPSNLLRIVMVVDGNSEDDQYMMEMFKEIFADQDPGCYVWQNNYHTWDPNVQHNAAGDAGLRLEVDPQRLDVEELIRTKRCVCIMQKWGGKREVMYTAFKALGSSVDYIQVCDSDTKLDPLATVELCKVLESNPKYGAVGGDVMILNLKDSYISFLSSLRYWMAFNIERSCQSFFDCVSCISGPLGLYRNDLLQQFLESWYNQTFLGTHCTFGDDRHLTNRMLSMGYSTKKSAQTGLVKGQGYMVNRLVDPVCAKAGESCREAGHIIDTIDWEAKQAEGATDAGAAKAENAEAMAKKAPDCHSSLSRLAAVPWALGLDWNLFPPECNLVTFPPSAWPNLQKCRRAREMIHSLASLLTYLSSVDAPACTFPMRQNTEHF